MEYLGKEDLRKLRKKEKEIISPEELNKPGGGVCIPTKKERGPPTVPKRKERGKDKKAHSLKGVFPRREITYPKRWVTTIGGEDHQSKNTNRGKNPFQKKTLRRSKIARPPPQKKTAEKTRIGV